MYPPVFTLVTSNQEKIHFAKIALGKANISFDINPISVLEIQSENPKELIEHKAKSAYELLQKPVVVSDHWWSIPAVGGFPGPYMRFVNDHMHAADILRLLQGITDRRVMFTECICYMDRNAIQPFFDHVHGIVLEQAQGVGVPGQQVFSLSDDGKSIAEHLNANTDPRGNTPRKVWQDLATWLQTERS